MIILIADDHVVFREGLSALLLQMPKVKEVMEASNGNEVLAILKKKKPDVILMDISMPEMDGIETTRAVKKGEFTSVPVIALTMFNRSQDILPLHDAGVNGYLLKESSISEIYKAISLVIKGEEYYCEPVKKVLLKSLMEREKAEGFAKKEQLTNREKEILVMICKELSTEEIAQQLFVSPLTINNHRRNILFKTGAKNVAGLVVYALKHGIYRVE
ncbi:MAG: response regulator [Bacteroidota bacterium]|jgi:DNA-binding NarL/FixJ family response regulator|nr:response regulator [Bacteroidota bacterium]MDF2453838.1 response regulator [Bacteroidota bacterium]